MDYKNKTKSSLPAVVLIFVIDKNNYKDIAELLILKGSAINAKITIDVLEGFTLVDGDVSKKKKNVINLHHLILLQIRSVPGKPTGRGTL